MAKYRITSIPQSLPKAQKGLFKNKLDIKTSQNKFKNLFDKGVLDNKGHINLFGKNKKGNSNQQTAPQETWSGVTPELIQPGQNPFELESTYTPTPEFTQADVNLSNTINKILEERQRLAQENDERKYVDNTNKYYDYNKPGFLEDTSHFTSLIWSSTQQIGCSLALTKDNRVYMVCYYYPQGNIIDEQLFKLNVNLPLSNNNNSKSKNEIKMIIIVIIINLYFYR